MRISLIISTLIVSFTATLAQAEIPWTFQPLPEHPPIPADNPQTDAKIELGKQLFFDPRLSLSGTHSCNSCHNLAAGGEDGLAQPVGVNGSKGRRSTQTLWNAAYHTVYNWDGSSKTLEKQALQHILDKNVMAMPDSQALLERINNIAGYRSQFASVFEGVGVTESSIAKAIASFERTLVTRNSPFDRFLNGDNQAISDYAQRGFEQFIEIRCASCHFWVNMAGPNPGLALQQGEGFYELFPNYPGTDYEKRYGLADDIGRYEFSRIKTDKRLWRVPSLRNVAITAPYFHNGAVKSLDEAVRVMAKTQLNRELTGNEVTYLVEFLKTLTGEFPQITLPRLPTTNP